MASELHFFSFVSTTYSGQFLTDFDVVRAQAFRKLISPDVLYHFLRFLPHLALKAHRIKLMEGLQTFQKPPPKKNGLFQATL